MSRPNSTIQEDYLNETFLSSNSTNKTYETTKYSSEIESVLIPIIFSMIFVIGVIGNVFLLVFVVRRRRLTSPHNMYVTSLAVGDLLMLTVSMSFMSTIYTFESWPYGETICKLSEFFHTCCTSETVYMLTALSAERLIIISGSHSEHQITRAVIVIFIVWVCSFMFAIPDLITANLQGEPEYQICFVYRLSWGEAYAKTMTIQKLLFLFIIPLIVTMSCYVILAIKLLFNPIKHPEVNTNFQNKARNTVRLIVLTLTLVILFIITWLPRRTFLMWFYFDPSPYNNNWHILKITGFCLMYANSSFNPLVFFVFEPAFRKFVLSCCKKQDYFPIKGHNRKTGHLIVMTELTEINENGTSV